LGEDTRSPGIVAGATPGLEQTRRVTSSQQVAPPPQVGPSAVRPGRPRVRTLAKAAKVAGIGFGSVLALAACAALVLWLAAGTRAFNERLDGRALAYMARTAERGGPDGTPLHLPFHDARELEELTRPAGAPLTPAVEPMPAARRLERPGLIQEELVFPSAISLVHAESNTARAYVYRRGPLGERPIILWVPGLFVSNLALSPISWFLRQELDRGADVVLYVPPYHLERTPAGFRTGEAFFASTLGDHVNAFAQELSDLRRLAAWLRVRARGPVGGFGGSLGALELLRLVTWDDPLDFLTVFIPVVRPTDLFERPESDPMRRRLAREGVSAETMGAVYGAFDLTAAPPPRGLDPARISVIYGRYDIVGPPESVRAWARAWGVTRLHVFDRGHTLALFSRQAHDAYARVLDEDLGAPRRGSAR
jgi:hypothetical protein